MKLTLSFQRMHCKCDASHHQRTVELDKGCNSWPSLGGAVVVGWPLMMDAKSASVGFLGNWFNSEAELTSGLICYCLPVFPQLYRQRIKKIFSSSSASHAYLHHGAFPAHNSYKRHFDSPQGVQELKPFQGSQLSAFQTHPIGSISQESLSIWKQSYLGNFGLKISFHQWRETPKLKGSPHMEGKTSGNM